LLWEFLKAVEAGISLTHADFFAFAITLTTELRKSLIFMTNYPLTSLKPGKSLRTTVLTPRYGEVSKNIGKPDRTTWREELMVYSRN
jgi:hypothetical protein